ncbi:MAG: IS1380 family transposase [Solirubrobacterales bacterium]|nr:IS1380 family transposase [Solirubrobacterales bacterium]
MVHDERPAGPNALNVVFDDERAVSDAGVVLIATLADRLGILELAGLFVRLGDRAGAANAGRKVMSLVYAMVLGADCIDDAEILRSGSTRKLLGTRVAAPSTLGTFLRAFTFGHVRQLDRLLAEVLKRAWAAGAGPGGDRLIVDVDSFVGEVHGYKKQGASFGYTGARGYHPLVATRAGSGEVLHVRFRKGAANTQRGMSRFCDELIARVRRAGATGPVLLRADSGFWNRKVFDKLHARGWKFSIGVRMTKPVAARVALIPEHAWQTLKEYPKTGEAQIAETTLSGRRRVVRRVRLIAGPGELFEREWRHFPFATNRTDDIEVVEAEHRQHAVVEQTIRDLKDQALTHFPSGDYNANAAWTVLACLAHNLHRWTSLIGLPGATVRTARTLRRRLLQMPGRLTRTARKWSLHLPARWPWQDDFIAALTRLRALPAPG